MEYETFVDKAEEKFRATNPEPPEPTLEKPGYPAVIRAGEARVWFEASEERYGSSIGFTLCLAGAKERNEIALDDLEALIAEIRLVQARAEALKRNQKVKAEWDKLRRAWAKKLEDAKQAAGRAWRATGGEKAEEDAIPF